MDLEIIDGNLLEASEQYICHQCNSVTTRGANLAQTVFKRFPYADIYSERIYGKEPSSDQLPGNIIIRGNGQDQRFVINLIGQYYPGKAKYPNSKRDGWEARRNAFQKALCKIEQIPDLKSIAFPFQVGCGAAGGDWPKYYNMIAEFGKRTQVRVRIYRLNNVLHEEKT